MQHLIDELQSQTGLYDTWLASELLSDQTRRAYTSRIKRFKVFLATCAEPEQVDKTRALREIAQKFHDHLMMEASAKPSSVNASITAVYHYYGFLGYKVPPVLRDWVLKNEPRVLTAEEQDRLILAIAGHASVRDRALITLILFTGIRIGECKDLKLSDVEISAHAGRVSVSSRNRSRTIPLNQMARQSLLQWLMERARKFDCEDELPLFPNKTGEFMTRAAIDEIVRKVARHAQLNICAQVLRNTFLTGLIESGNKLEFVAEIAGQAKLEHVRRFRKDKTIASVEAPFTATIFDNSWAPMQQDVTLLQ
jgi:site-specific recombinase XerD